MAARTESSCTISKENLTAAKRFAAALKPGGALDDLVPVGTKHPTRVGDALFLLAERFVQGKLADVAAPLRQVWKCF